MKKQILTLSVVLAVCAGTPAFAQQDPLDDITTGLTAPVATATANPDGSGTPADILIDNGGEIVVTTGGPAVTINSDNSFKQLTGTQISNMNTDSAVGILVDLTTNSINATNVSGCTTDCAHTFEGLIENGDVDLSGTGSTKRAIWFEGPTTDSGLPANTFTGDVDMSGSTITVKGDSSVGVLIDPLAIVNGTMTFGTLDMQTTSLTSTSAGIVGFQNEGVINGDIRMGFIDTVNSIHEIANLDIEGSSNSTSTGTIAVDLGGTLNGNFTIDDGSSIVATGSGAAAILLTGNINACDQTVSPGCTSVGSFINKGIIEALGTNLAIINPTGNPTSGIALAIGGNIAGGIYNAGPSSTDDHTVASSIVNQSFLPAVEISPAFQTMAPLESITIGVFADTIDPGFSFLNRGAIQSGSDNFNQSSNAVMITGTGVDGTATLTGGFFNSNAISSIATTSSSATASVSAVAIAIGADALVGPGDLYTYQSKDNGGCDCMVYTPNTQLAGYVPKLPGDQAAFVNSDEAGSGSILATVSGSESGNTAIAIDIGVGATLPSIINSGTIQASALTGDASITGLSAIGILDASGTLTYIQNNGTIKALVSTLTDGSQQQIAIDLSGDKTGAAANGVEILDQATAAQGASIIGDIRFGTGDHQIVDVLGTSTENTAVIIGDIKFGGGSIFGSDELNIGNFASVTGTITADPNEGVTVNVLQDGILTITNNTTALNAAGFHVAGGGVVNLTVYEDFNTGIVNAAINPAEGGYVTFDTLAKLNIAYGSFVPANSSFVLFTAPTASGGINIPQSDTDAYNAQLKTDLPFLFSSASLSIVSNPDTLTQSYVLNVQVKDAKDLGLTGYAAQMLPFANQALVNDDPLGAAIVSGIVDQKSAENAYDQFAPDVTGGARAIAMSLTDQATGPVAARQRMLRMYGKDSGDVTLWGQEFAEFIKDPGDASTNRTGFKDHGFGFVLGLDGGEPKTGWYGGAFSFYSGDITEALPRDSHSNSLWYTATGYTDWRGKGLFLDTKVDVGYFAIKQKRILALTIPSASGGASTSFVDEADSKRPGLVGSAGFTTGVILAYGGTTITPQLSMDALTLREEGYSESHPTTAPGNGKGFDLTVSSNYANSARVFVGADIRQDLDFGDFFIQPDVRLGYRYDFLSDASKVKAQFSDVPINGIDQRGPLFTIEGPDPSQGNVVAGASLSATTDAWTIGANFDFVRGTNGATTEVGTIHLLGRI